MRLIGKLPNPGLARRLSQYLIRQGIENQCDDGEVWIYDENKIDQATTIYEQFLQNPADPQFAELFEPPAQATRKRWGNLTIFTIAVCAILFVWGMVQVVTTKSMLLNTPVYEALLYDYPPALDIQKKLLRNYTPEQLENPQTLPPEGKKLLKELNTADFFRGFYGFIVEKVKNGKELDGPLFVKIRQGQVWRLFTPALLHGNLLHIFFNVIWLVVLGNQMEHRLGWPRYLLFILVVGILSNTAQYLMGGPLFLGLSGIVCGLLGFIWMRQRLAPWEGYLLNRMTILFLTAFILGMAALQTVFFILEITGTYTIGVGIANTAHISGVIVGALMGRLKLMRVK